MCWGLTIKTVFVRIENRIKYGVGLYLYNRQVNVVLRPLICFPMFIIICLGPPTAVVVTKGEIKLDYND